MAQRMKTVAWWLLAVVVAAGFARLGAWQLHRAHEKQAMLDQVAQVLAEKKTRPLSLANDAARARDYDWAAGVGVFADAPALLLDNQSRNGRYGMRAYRLFEPRGAAPLLVELGWLPMPDDRKLAPVARPQGEIEIRGLLLPPPSRGLMAGIATPQADGDVLATAMDAPNLPALLQVGKLSKRVLRLDPRMHELGYVRDLDVLPNTLPPAQHYSYAVQWFGLALTVLATAAVLSLRRRFAGRAKMRG